MLKSPLFEVQYNTGRTDNTHILCCIVKYLNGQVIPHLCYMTVIMVANGISALLNYLNDRRYDNVSIKVARGSFDHVTVKGCLKKTLRFFLGIFAFLLFFIKSAYGPTIEYYDLVKIQNKLAKIKMGPFSSRENVLNLSKSDKQL